MEAPRASVTKTGTDTSRRGGSGSRAAAIAADRPTTAAMTATPCLLVIAPIIRRTRVPRTAGRRAEAGSRKPEPKAG